METIKVTKHKSYCCDAPIHYKIFKKDDYTSENPFCSKCNKFPEAPIEALDKALKLLKSGKLGTLYK